MNFIFHDYYWILIFTSFVTAIVSASIGFLGGTILLSVMAQFLAPTVLIPVHGLVQLWSNSTRAAFLTKSINWRIVSFYGAGTVFGSLLASQYVLKIPEHYYSLGLGIIILILTLTPKENWSRFFYKKKSHSFLDKWLFVGFFTSFLGLFIGAIGVLVGAVFLTEDKLDKKMMVATQAACQCLVHFAKVVVFIYLGFQLGPWMGLLFLLIFTTLAGSYVGTRLLDKIPQALFLKIFKALIVLLSLRLVWLGIQH